MSSLSQQLKAIGERNASVALDRKSRAAIHSRSLIFEPKVAAAQDFDYIYSVACEGLDELVEIDLRFAKFRATLFSETSVGFDRNTAAKDVVAHADKNALAFVNMAAPYFGLGPALKALEWLVRRYNINIHHPEALFLAALPYHTQPVFTRFMTAVAKGQWPAMFAPLLGYRDAMAAPPTLALVKCFYNDSSLYRLYSQHVVDLVQHKTVYKEQLVFYLAATAQVLALHSRHLDKLNDEYVPVILELAVEFLRDHAFRSPALAQDVRLTIYAVLAVLCLVAPLSSELLVLLTQLLVGSTQAFEPLLRRQTLIALGQLWHFCNEQEPLGNGSAFAALPVPVLLADEPLLATLQLEGFYLAKFLYFYFADRASAGDADATRVVAHIRTELPFLFDAVATKLVRLLDTPLAESVRACDAVLQRMYKADEGRFLAVLDQEHRTLGDLEMALLRTLGGLDVPEAAEVATPAAVSVSQTELFEKLATPCALFLAPERGQQSEFWRLARVLMKELTGSRKQQGRTIMAFLRAALGSADARGLFLVRLALTPAVPGGVRLAAVDTLEALVRAEFEANGKTAFYLLAPVLLLGLGDPSPPIRAAFQHAVASVHELTAQLVAQLDKKNRCTLFMESAIYGGPARSVVSPRDALRMLDVLQALPQLHDVAVDSGAVVRLVFDVLFKASSDKQKKFGLLLLRTFVLNQWAADWPLALKARVWLIVAARNAQGTEDRFVFADDVERFVSNPHWQAEAREAGLDEAELQTAVVSVVGGPTADSAKMAKEVDWLLRALRTPVQVAASQRLATIFGLLDSELRVRVCTEFVEMTTGAVETALEFDPVEALQALALSSSTLIALLNSVNIVTHIPEQGVAKRRRRSLLSTQKTMARDDISTIASQHLRKLLVILDVVESHLRRRAAALASPPLLQAMFKILTDLDYLANDGKMPVMYAQETLASCMLLTIVDMKAAHQKHALDSNSVRADLVVNLIRLSQLPQVQNRLLLVVAELAALAPEIILHSVMPIFTFMGAHTIRQDDEFSSIALSQTIAKVIPAITASSESADTEIEFLLTSFVTAFPHIPRHRRVKLFVSLVKTLGCKQSLHTILFLIGQQYAANIARHKAHDCDALLDFVSALLKTFSAAESMDALVAFQQLWDSVPAEALEKDSDEYAALNARPVFGSAVVNASTKELAVLRFRLMQFLNRVLAADNNSQFSQVSLKMKVALVLFDDMVGQDDKDTVLALFNKLTSFTLTALETYGAGQGDLVEELYDSLKSFLNLLPLSHYISSITASLKNANDPMSIKIARNFAVLAGQRFESEVTANSLDDAVDSAVTEQFLPVLVHGIQTYTNVELVQAYLDTFATIVNTVGTNEQASAATAKFLVGSLKAITSECGLLSEHVEIVISSLNAINSVITCLGVKCIGYFPKILPPSLKIWENTLGSPQGDSDDEEDSDDEDEDDEDEDEDDDDDDEESGDDKALLQGSVLMLFSCLVKRMPTFVISSLKQIIRAVLLSEEVSTQIRAGVLDLVVEHIDKAQVLQALCNLALTENVYGTCSASGLGLYLSCMAKCTEGCDKKTATSHSPLFVKWMIASLEFRTSAGETRFNENTLHSIEGSLHKCGLMFVMKLNDKNFRPLFASMVRWAVSGEGALLENRSMRLVPFFKFFIKLQDNLRSIITLYFSYILDPTIELLKEFKQGTLVDSNLRRIILHSLASAFKYDQDDYWSHQLRFDTVVEPLVGQLSNIEDSIGKHLVKAITFFVSNVSSEDHNEKLVQTLIYYVSNEHENLAQTKIWTIRVLKAVLQKLGEQWLLYLPTFIPYIAELLEDDDEEVEMEVRKDLVRVIENILGEPLDRYLA